MHYTLHILLLLPPIASSLSNFPIVQTSYGAVRGYEYRADNGFVGEIFKKIPFAAPPTGARRWKKPEPPFAWNYTLDGTFFGPRCSQVPSMNKGSVTGTSEDCLTLNIYTSTQCRESAVACPVVIFIHGGIGYFGGASAYHDETLVTNFASKGVILVTTQYRLGPFGALALGDENAVPANLALHDVRESLKFVSAEIRAFGGDKDQIGVMGMSSGANIVLTLVFSPAFNKPGETPLFARALSMSGSAVYETEEKQVTVSHGMAEKLGCVGTAREIIECLLPLESNDILQAAIEEGGDDPFSATQISGVTNAGELMPIRNMKDLRDNQKDHMSSLLNSQPTKLVIGTVLNEFGTVANVNDSRVFASNGVLGVRNVEECNRKYVDDRKSGKFDPGCETISESIFLTTALFAQSHALAGGEVYVYNLDFPGMEHGDDMMYTIKGGVPTNDNEVWLSRVYPVYFTNFFKGLPPAPDWTPFDAELMNYYSINKSFTKGFAPQMKFNYQQKIADYYKGMLEFDENLTKMKKQLFNEQVEMKQLNLFSGKHLELLDILFYSTIFGLFLFLVFCLCRYHRSREASVEEKMKLVI